MTLYYPWIQHLYDSLHIHWPQTAMILTCIIYSTGTPVLAMWRDKHYYPGHVVQHTKSKYSVQFEDGGTHQVKESDLIMCDLLPAGQEVMASEDNCDFDVGVVTQMASQGNKRGLLVKFKDENTAL